VYNKYKEMRHPKTKRCLTDNLLVPPPSAKIGATSMMSRGKWFLNNRKAYLKITKTAIININDMPN